MKTNLNYFSKLVILFLMFTTTVFSQSITNTLGTNGLFTIKDAANNYLTLSQSTGQVNILRTLHLQNTTSSGVGTIFKGGERFLHNFGPYNTFLGTNSGNFTLISANENTGIGHSSLLSLTTGDGNSALGIGALYSNNSGSYNTALGHKSLYNNTTGSNNTALGLQSLFSDSTGSENTAIGFRSLYFNTTGNQNTAVGYTSLYSNTTGNFNTGLGLNSLSGNTTGDLNTALGFSSGSLVANGNNLTLVGYDAEPSSGSANNQITLGNNSVTSLRCNVQTITSLSDARDKKNIKDLSLGLDFLMKVKPRLFNWDKREWYENNISDGTKIEETPTAGFIAQELDEVQTTENAEWLNLVMKDNPEKIEATYGNLLPVMVKAIQELKVESEKLNMENISLKNENKEMKERLSKFEQTQNVLMSELEKLKSKESNIKEVKLGEAK